MIFVRHFVKNDNIFNAHVKKGYWLDRLLYGLFNEKKKYHVVYSGACVALLCIKKNTVKFLQKFLRISCTIVILQYSTIKIIVQ